MKKSVKSTKPLKMKALPPADPKLTKAEVVATLCMTPKQKLIE